MMREQNINLPAVDPYLPPATSLQYGVDRSLARYCELASYPGFFEFIWQHGWHAPHLRVHPTIVTQEAAQPKDRILVAREDQRAYLLNHGFEDVHAIGLPIVYTERPNVERRPNTLLVMPAHSLSYTEHQWRFDEYLNAINLIRDQFDEVVVCIHPECIKKGYWRKQFSEAGYQIVAGATVNDRNAHQRIATLLSSFEYVTTNFCGSHVPYAAYFGAKISVYGPYAEYKAEDYKNTPFYRQHPEILEPTVAAVSEKSYRTHFPFLFTEPRAAKQLIDWGSEQVGADNKLSPEVMRTLLGWDASSLRMHRLKKRVRRVLRFCNKFVPPAYSAIKHRIEYITNKKHRDQLAEVHRLNNLPRYTPTTVAMQGRSLKVVDFPTYLHAKNVIIDQGIYCFVTTKDAPVILDCGANIGLSVIYFKQLYPNSKITAFEPDPDVFKVLKENCKTFEVTANTELIPKAVWNKEETLSFEKEGADAGRVEAAASGDKVVSVQSVRLRNYLEKGPVDMLKMDIEGAETSVIVDCADMLHHVENLFVEYHSFTGKPQTLHIIMSILAQAGFRVHVHPESISPQPFFLRGVHLGMDHQLNIFAFR